MSLEKYKEPGFVPFTAGQAQKTPVCMELLLISIEYI
jgi:hypothetical protein